MINCSKSIARKVSRVPIRGGACRAATLERAAVPPPRGTGGLLLSSVISGRWCGTAKSSCGDATVCSRSARSRSVVTGVVAVPLANFGAASGSAVGLVEIRYTRTSSVAARRSRAKLKRSGGSASMSTVNTWSPPAAAS